MQPPSLERFNNELSFRGEQGRSLHRLLETGAVERGLRCGAVSVPTHKLIPDTRWVLDLGASRVVARSDPSAASQRKARYGVAIFPVGRTNILRTGFAVNTDAITQVPAPGFQRIATDKYFAAYLRCPPGVPDRLRRHAPSPFGLALAGVLALAFGLRLWGIRHGLPFVYNVDEASNFVPTAVSYYFTDSYNPHYFINPPAFSYLLHLVLGTWFGGGWPFGAEGRRRQRASPPTPPGSSSSRGRPRRCWARPRSRSST